MTLVELLVAIDLFNDEARWDKLMTSSEWGRQEIPQREMRYFFRGPEPCAADPERP